jgi:hypothetical protein
MTNEHTTTPAEAITALQGQIDALDDAIGQAAGTWRELAADPARAGAAATRLGDMERQREILRAALTEAQLALESERTASSSEAFELRVTAAGERLLPLLQQRCELGERLQEAVDRVGDLIQRLHDQGFEIVRACDMEVAAVSGIDTSAATRTINTEDLHSLIDQQLGGQLKRLWPVEVAPASFGVRVAQRIAREVTPLENAFQHGVAERRSQVGGAA